MTLEKNLSGFYTVDGKIFYDKIEAILYANERNLDIEWNYFNEIFYSINWMEEPETSLDEFYKLRAQQLREKYDYIILFCSGGADSTNMAYSFLKNGIHIDEIYAGAPLSGLKNFKKNNIDISASNVISETFYAQLPFLEDLHSKYPEVRITVNDYFEDMLNYKEDEWIFKSSDWIHPTTVARYSLEKFDHIKKLCDQGKNVAAIYGCNKPNVIIVGNNFVNLIDDTAINVARPAFKNHPVYIEPFYTTPDLPLLSVKQSHAVAKWALEPGFENRIKMLSYKAIIPHMMTESTFMGKHWNNAIYERSIVPTIYPSLNYTFFQGEKPNYQIMADHDDWFYDLHKDTTAHKIMLSDISNFLKEINVKYFRNFSKKGFKTCKSMFPIGNIYTFNKK